MIKNKRHTDTNKIPICVDLDGTLIKTDLLVESLFILIRTNLFYVFLIPYWLTKGRAFLKYEIAKRVELDVSTLPYRIGFLEYLRNEHSNGKILILATATNEYIANQVADYLGIFNGVVASDNVSNIKGQTKSNLLVERFGESGFDYAGDNLTDIAIWKKSRKSIVVGASKRTIRSVEKISSMTTFFDCEPFRIVYIVKALRIHQWLKNLLIFAPILAAHQLTNVELFMKSLVGAFSFCLCASSIYILNDFFDLQFDREHEKKRHRPLASGNLSPFVGLFFVPILLLLSFSTSIFLLPFEFSFILGTYFLVSIVYSLYLKSYLLIDVITLAALYTARIIAGSAATFIMPSFWMLAFSMFLFLSLALVKRYTELYRIASRGNSTSRGRGYVIKDLESLMSLGTSSGYIAVLVLALYINSLEVKERYSYPEGIWLLCPLLLYWTSRLWVRTGRGSVNDDPVVFAMQDRASRWTLGIALLILFISA